MRKIDISKVTKVVLESNHRVLGTYFYEGCSEKRIFGFVIVKSQKPCFMQRLPYCMDNPKPLLDISKYIKKNNVLYYKASVVLYTIDGNEERKYFDDENLAINFINLYFGQSNGFLTI